MEQNRSQLFSKDQIPATFEQTIKAKWGNEVEATPARSNGNYAGPVVADDKFVAQKVSDKSVVFHERNAIDFKSNVNMEKRDKENRLNDVQMSIRYENDKAKAYFHDPQRANINVMFAKIEKEAGEQLKGKSLDTFTKQLEGIKTSMIEKHKERQDAAFKERTGQSHDRPADQPAKPAPAKRAERTDNER